MNRDEEFFSMVQECTNSYEVIDDPAKNEVEIRIIIPTKFRNVWMRKLSDLQTNMKEVEEYNDN